MASEHVGVKLHPEAFDELAAAVRFYAERDRRIAENLKVQLRDAFQNIHAHPMRFPALRELPDVRKFNLRRFPISVLYLIRPGAVWIIAIAHSRRRPQYWKQRAIGI
jgi:toxin ParE1/3/4